MTRILALFAVAVFAFTSVASAQAAPVDQALAKKGKALFGNRGCAGCHTFGKKLAGPDLVGATERRDKEWMRNWLKTPDKMLETDSVAKAMLAEFQNVKMPNMKLSDADVDALVHYMQQETDKKKK
jgi:mono/diheme cytochrome c family protein